MRSVLSFAVVYVLLNSGGNAMGWQHGYTNTKGPWTLKLYVITALVMTNENNIQMCHHTNCEKNALNGPKMILTKAKSKVDPLCYSTVFESKISVHVSFTLVGCYM